MLILMLAMIIVPLPPFALDTLFTFNIALAVAILLTAIYVRRPLDFGVFPTRLLVVTLLRLALNIASTRVVLLDGHAIAGGGGGVVRLLLDRREHADRRRGRGERIGQLRGSGQCGGRQRGAGEEDEWQERAHVESPTNVGRFTSSIRRVPRCCRPRSSESATDLASPRSG